MASIGFQRKLEEFQKRLDVPKWYWGLSEYQEKAVKSLTADLRDDFEQGTSYRVEKSLTRLGVCPLITKKKIQNMVKLSRGNDLAFLFFILEGYYTSPRRDGEYTTNEKLLTMGIALLDLLPTLRELDRILPPPQLSALDLKRQNRNQLRLSCPSKLMVDDRAKKPKRLPYFQRQPRPKEITVDYISKPPNHIASFPFWPLDQPPNYGTERETPWFSDYNLNPVARLVKSTVGEAVDKYFNQLNRLIDLQSRARKSRRAAAELEKLQATPEEKPKLCKYHDFMLTETQRIKDELLVKAVNRTMELMDVTMPYRKLRQRRIIAELENDVDIYSQRYALKMSQTTVHTISKSNCAVYQKKRVSLPLPKPQEKKGRLFSADCPHLAHAATMSKNVGKRLSGGGIQLKSIDFAGPLLPCRNLPNINLLIPDTRHSTDSKKAKKQRCSPIIDAFKSKQPRKDRKEAQLRVQSEAKQTKKIFFKAPTEHKPYQFKYKRIFKTDQEQPRKVQRTIDQAFLNALKEDDSYLKPKCQKKSLASSEDEVDVIESEMGLRLTDSCPSDSDTSEHSTHSHEDRKADIIDAVVQCAQQMWMKGVNNKRSEMERIEAENAAKETVVSVLQYENDKFDPDDDELMNRMLEDGLKELRKNQRYVLASLPLAHKLPVLKEWIKRRYGKQYTEAEMQKSIQESEKIFEMITILQNNPPAPDLMGMDRLPPEKENFNYAKAAKALGEKVREAYYQKLNDIYMNHTRACWYAMGNFQCPGGPPRKVFYAYMSANTRDIMRNRVWNGEFRNIRQYRDAYREKHSTK